MLDAHGWRTLGDIGLLDEDGYLYLTDRQAHMIISGGVNIYPQEAENVLAGDPRVADVAVIGVPDAEMGEAVKAVVELVDPVNGGARHRSRADRGVPGTAGRLQVPSECRLRHRVAPRPERKALQTVAQGALLGGPRHAGRVIGAVIGGQPSAPPADVVDVVEVVDVGSGGVAAVVVVEVGGALPGDPVGTVNSHAPAAQSADGVVMTA